MKKNVIRKLDEIQEKLYAASDKIWNEPEIAFQEYKSMDVLCKLLEEEGFSIEKNLVGIPTAFRAVYGSGKPEIAFLGEKRDKESAIWPWMRASCPGSGCGRSCNCCEELS